MEIERQTEVRLATWLCEAIEDAIKRYHFVAEMDEKAILDDEAKAREEREKQSDPLIGRYANPQMYEQFAENGKTRVSNEKEAIDQLLSVLNSAKEVRSLLIQFWEMQNKRWEARSSTQ